MSYISTLLLLLFFLTQQNQLSLQKRRRGSLEGFSLGQDLRRLLAYWRGIAWRQQMKWRRCKRGGKGEEGHSKRKSMKRCGIQRICISRSWAGRCAHEWTAADKAVEACQNPAVGQWFMRIPPSKCCFRSPILQLSVNTSTCRVNFSLTGLHVQSMHITLIHVPFLYIQSHFLLHKTNSFQC